MHSKPRRLYRDPTFQVLGAILLGGIFGHYFPEQGTAMKVLGDGFIRLIKMIIGPIIFLTIVTGIAHVGDFKKVGRVGGKAILYFEIVTTIGLILGMLAMNIFRPGDGFDAQHAAKGDVSKYITAGKQHHTVSDFLLNIIPDNIVAAFIHGDLLQILFVAILFGVALSKLGPKGRGLEHSLEKLTHAIFGIIGMIMKLAPLGAFGAVAFTVGTYGIEATIPLLKLLLLAIATMLVFIAFVLGPITYWYGFNVWKFIYYIKDELLIVFGTGSSEPVLPRMLEKLQRLGCSKPVVGLVLPTGYSFNLDGSTLYLAMCVLFVAQAYAIDFALAQQLSILGLMLVTSKGAAGVAGSAFIVLAATVSATGILPVEGIAILLGIDRFMSSIRAMVNLIGNGVATIVIAKSEKEFDESKALAEYRECFKNAAIEKI